MRGSLAWPPEESNRRQTATRPSLTGEDLVAAAGDLARIEIRRARSRVLEHAEREREWSEPMPNTPRKGRFEHALRGFRPRFPVSSESYAKEIVSHVQTRSFYPEGTSFGLSRTPSRYVGQAEKLPKSGKHAEAQALLRGWLIKSGKWSPDPKR